MKLLPEEHWLVQFTDSAILVGAYGNGPEERSIFWQKFMLSQFRREVICIDDLKAAIVDAVHRSPIPQD